MKRKILVFVTLFAVLFLLTGCFVSRDYYFEDVQVEKISSIQFYDTTDAQRNDYDECKSENVLATQPFFELPTEKHQEFLDRLKALDFGYRFVLGMAVDWSYEYGDYVVKITYDDNSFKLFSCSGVFQDFDLNGVLQETEYYGCDYTAWNNLIYDYCGSISTRICYNNRDVAMKITDHQTVTHILSTMTKIETDDLYEFEDDDFLICDGQRYFLALDDYPIIQLEDSLYQISEDNYKILCEIIVNYIGYWRYSPKTQ